MFVWANENLAVRASYVGGANLIVDGAQTLR
jgi:hypothetical protein